MIAAVAAAMLASGLVRICLREIWDAITAVAIFVALFTAGGTWLAGIAEHGLRALDPTAYDAPRGMIVVSAGLGAASLVAGVACATVAALHRFAARMRGEPG